jgi:hypothetical protein
MIVRKIKISESVIAPGTRGITTTMRDAIVTGQNYQQQETSVEHFRLKMPAGIKAHGETGEADKPHP